MQVVGAPDYINVQSASLNNITKRVEPVLEEFHAFMHRQIGVFEPEIQDSIAYCFKHQGKHLRPIFVFYGGFGGGKDVQEGLIKLAAIVEMIHLATLVHDDIIDDADTRHGSLTVHAKEGIEIAVLLGDALFAQALRLASDFPTVRVCRMVSEATKKLCAGEINQTFERGNIGYSFEQYYRAIDLKTAELFSVAAELGSEIAGFDEYYIKSLSVYGRHLGQAYQIFDDISDLVGNPSEIGKTLGTDLTSQKYTLPMLYLIPHLTKNELNELKEKVQSGFFDNASMHALLNKYDVLSKVKVAFDEQIKAAQKAIWIHPNIDHLMDLSEFFRSIIRKYC